MADSSHAYKGFSVPAFYYHKIQNKFHEHLTAWLCSWSNFPVYKYSLSCTWIHFCFLQF